LMLLVLKLCRKRITNQLGARPVSPVGRGQPQKEY
jgi:hypothetical protein